MFSQTEIIQYGTHPSVKSKKGEDPLFSFEYSGSVIPHPQKVQKGGEDAHFVSSRGLGVADGKLRFSNLQLFLMD